MQELKLHTIDLAIVAFYLITCIYLGLRKKTKATNFKEFAVSSGVLPTFALVSMFFATHIGAGTTVGAVERIYSLGVFYGIAYLINPLFWIITAAIFAKNIEKFDGCLSLPDVMNRLYGKVGRWTTVALSIGTCVGVIAVQLSALGYLAQHFLGLPNYLGVTIGCFIICINIFFGGAKAVVITDIFQFCIFYIAIPSLCALALSEVQGFDGLVERVPAELISLNLNSENIWLFISFIFYALLPLADSTFIQRFLMARNSERLKRALYNTALIGLPFACVIFLIGLLSRALAPDINANEAFYFLLSRYAPIGFLGLLISGMLAVVMSTANSWLNSASVICANDIAPIFSPKISRQSQLVVARVATIVITALAILLATKYENLISLVWLADNFWYPVMFLPIVFGFKGLDSNSRTFTISMITAVICTLVARYLREDFDTITMCVGMLGSFISFTIAHFIQFGNILKFKSRYSFFSKLQKSISHYKMDELGYHISPEMKNSIFIFCTFMIFQYIPSIFEAAESGSINYPLVFFIRTLSVTFAIILFSHEYWESNLRVKLLSKFWTFNILFSLVFSPTLMFLLSANKIIWLINGALCFTLLNMFFTFKRMVTLIAIGGAIGVLTYQLSGGIEIGKVIANTSAAAGISLIYGLIGILLILVSRRIFDSKVLTLANSTGYVAHEARGSLASSSAFVSLTESIILNAKVKNKGAQTLIETSKEDWENFVDIHHKTKSRLENGINVIKSILNLHSTSYDDFAIYKFSSIVENVLSYTPQNRVDFRVVKDFKFYGSQKAMEIALSNIVSNFLKYAGKKATLAITVNNGVITFRDNGAGIKANILSNIFDSKTTTQGHGLGLTLCKRIINEHGGEISCDSELGKFTEFTIRLPQVS